MSNAAKVQDVEKIHEMTTRALLRILERIDPDHALYDSTFMPNPAVFGHIIKFLQMNDIKAVAVPDSPLAQLKKSGKLLSLPFLEPRERTAIESQ